MILLDKTEFIDCNEATLKMFMCKHTEEFIAKQIDDWSAHTQAQPFKNNKDLIKTTNEEDHTFLEKK